MILGPAKQSWKYLYLAGRYDGAPMNSKARSWGETALA